MGTPVKIYRILSYILLPNAAFFGIIGVLMLIPALMAPMMLFTVFLFVCTSIYSFVTLSFLQKGIIQNRPCKPSLRDWIRVNGFVSMVLGIQLILRGGGSVMMSDAEVTTLVDQMLELQPMLKDNFSAAKLASIFKAVFIYFLVSGIILVAHLFMSFRFLKQYGGKFENLKI